MLLEPKSPMYLRDVHMTQISQPSEGKKRSNKANACAISLVLEPFLKPQARKINAKMADKLFDKSGLANPEIKMMGWVMSPGRQDAYFVAFRGTPDQKDPACSLRGVQVNSILHIQRDKDASVFKATMAMKFEADKNQLAYLAANYTGQLFVTIELEQPPLEELSGDG